jgi:anti-sigma factor RsiW
MPISDADLHAYVDGELDEHRCLEVEAYLAENPQAAERCRKYQELHQGLHSLFDPVLNETVPVSLMPGSVSRGMALRRSPQLLLQAAAVAGIMLLSGYTGWLIGAKFGAEDVSQELVHLVQPAAFAHTVYSTDPYYPVEMGADRQQVLASWLSDRMHTDMRAPLLGEEGFELVGGRLLPSTNRMAAQFMYQDKDGKRVTLYIRRGAWKNRETAFHYTQQDGLRVFYWLDGPMGYAVSGDVEKSRLMAVAHRVHLSLESTTQGAS